MLQDWSPHRIAAISYGIASIVFLLLALLLLRDWRARRHAAALMVACVLTSWWALWAALQGLPSSMPFDVLEIARGGAWALFLLLLLGSSEKRLRAWLLLFCTMTLLPLLNAMGIGAAVTASALIVAHLALALLGVLLVEQLYRGTPPRQRWGVKFACLGIGGLYVYDFYLYSDALLFGHVTVTIWTARGLVDALTAPLVAISAARNPAWALGLTVSRQMMLRSAALIGAASYLLAMAASAYYLRYIGGAWGPVMQLAYLCGAAMLLAGVLFSGAMRARLKVFLNKHFYQAGYDYRQEWLRFTRALSEGGPGLAERSIQAVAALVESPAGALWLRRERGIYEQTASWNMAPLPARAAAPLRRSAPAVMAGRPAAALAAGAVDAARRLVRLHRADAAARPHRAQLGSDGFAEDRRQPGRQLPRAPAIGRIAVDGAPIRIVQPHVRVYRARREKSVVAVVAVVVEHRKSQGQSGFPGRYAGHADAYGRQDDGAAAQTRSRRAVLCRGAAAAGPAAGASGAGACRVGAAAGAVDRGGGIGGAGRLEPAGTRARAPAAKRHRGHAARRQRRRAPAARRRGRRGRAARQRRGHERGIHPRAFVQAIRYHQSQRHGHRRVRKPRLCA